MFVPATAVTAFGALTASASPKPFALAPRSGERVRVRGRVAAGVAAISAMNPSKPAAFQRARTSRSWPGRQRDHRAAAARAGQLGADRARGARRVDQRVQLGPRHAQRAQQAVRGVERPPQAVDVALGERAGPRRRPACPARPGCRRRRTAARAGARPPRPAPPCRAGAPTARRTTGSPGSTGTGPPPVARENRPAAPVFAAAASMPDGLPWKIASAASTAASIAPSSGARPLAAAAARAIATASAAELPSPARDGMAAVGVEVQRRRLQPAHDRRQRPPDRAVVAGRRLEAPGRDAQPPAARPRRRRRSRPTARRPAPRGRRRPRARRPGSPCAWPTAARIAVAAPLIAASAPATAPARR